jgi:hypothetical protein
MVSRRFISFSPGFNRVIGGPPFFLTTVSTVYHHTLLSKSETVETVHETKKGTLATRLKPGENEMKGQYFETLQVSLTAYKAGSFDGRADNSSRCCSPRDQRGAKGSRGKPCGLTKSPGEVTGAGIANARANLVN